MADGYETQRPRRRRGRRLLTVVVVLLLLLGAGLVALDRFGASYAERVLADRVAQEVVNQKSTSGLPEVTIAGVPFLTQVAAGDYQEVRIEVPDLTAPDGNGGEVSMPLLDIRAKDVRAPLNTLRTGTGDVVAGSVSGTGTVDYAQIASRIQQKGLKLAESDGKLIATVPFTALGQTVDVRGAADLAVKDGVVQVRFSEVSAPGLAANPFVEGLIRQLAANLGFDLQVPPLPLSLTVRDVQVLPEGLKVTAGAENVNLAAGGL